MPNWFYFDLTVEGPTKDVGQFCKDVSGTETYVENDEEKEVHIDFDFNKIIPQPDNIMKGPLSLGDREKYDEMGIPNWYDWNCANWGTKWNARVDRVWDADYNENEMFSSTTYNMRTAWNFPAPVINKMMEMYPNLTFRIQGFEESDSYGVYIDTDKDEYIVDSDPRYFYEGDELYWDDGDYKFVKNDEVCREYPDEVVWSWQSEPESQNPN